MTRIRSMTILAASVVGFGLFSAATGFFVFYGGESYYGDEVLRVRSALALSVLGGPMGLLYWAMSVEPVKVPERSKGWRRWRPLMWLAGLTAAYTIVVMGFGRPFMDALSGSLFFSVFVTLFGWAVGATRADRARSIASHKARVAVAGRLKEVMLEIAKSDPYGLSFDDIKTFLQEPFAVVARMASGESRPAFLAYGRGVLAATIVPETMNDKSVAAEYVMILSTMKDLLQDERIETTQQMEDVLTYLEKRAETFRKARLAKKL